MEIIPAIVSQNLNEIVQKVSLVDGLVTWVQVDVVDGLFASGRTWDRPEELMQIEGKVKVETHLMIETPELELDEWLRVADRIIVHYEATQNMPEILAKFKNSAVKLGIALLLETPIKVLEPLAEQFSLVQLMAIGEIGHHGEALDPKVIEKIKALRAAYPNVTISVDGGINLQNASALLTAGADNLVVGSAIWKSSDVPGTIKKFQALHQ